MSPYLESIADTYAASRERLHALLAEADDDAFNRRPSEKGWSAGECVVHLNTIAERYHPVLDEAFGPVAPRGEGPFRWGWFARKFVAMNRPGGRPLPTDPSMRPPKTAGLRSDVDRDRAVAEFDARTDGWLALCERADGLDLARIKVTSPFLRVLRLPAGAFLESLGLHALRHVGQAERAVRGG